jgi:hypothetical protein
MEHMIDGHKTRVQFSFCHTNYCMRLIFTIQLENQKYLTTKLSLLDILDHLVDSKGGFVFLKKNNKTSYFSKKNITC